MDYKNGYEGIPGEDGVCLRSIYSNKSNKDRQSVSRES